MKIGDEVYVHGYVDEIRKGTYVDIVIIRNKGGYFGTDASEVILADRKAEPQPCNWCKFSDGENCFSQEPCKVMLYFKTEPQTDCSWK